MQLIPLPASVVMGRVPLYVGGNKVKYLDTAKLNGRHYHACLVTTEAGQVLDGFWTDTRESMNGAGTLMVDISVVRPPIRWNKVPREFRYVNWYGSQLCMHTEHPSSGRNRRTAVLPRECFAVTKLKASFGHWLREFSLQERPE